MPTIEVSHLTKAFRTYKKQPGFGGAVKGLFRRKYEQTVAVKDVSFVVGPGELVGFLGPNGAGKTTTIKMLVGLLRPTSGSATVAGYDIQLEPEQAKARIGYVPDSASLYEKLSAREFLEFSGDLYHVDR